jgi:hypothetical protein
MAILLRWITAGAPSCFYAAAVLARGETLADRSLESSLQAPTASFRAEAAARRLDPDLLLDHLVPLSATVGGDAELARAALENLDAADGHQSTTAASLAAAVGALQRAFLAAKPQAAEELSLRQGPLREQWEARGPGLMARLERLIGLDWIAAEADVLLVHPVRGGGGAVHAGYNSVSFEAVLANPFHELPEVVRLAWLLARLGTAQTLGSHELDPARGQQLLAIALLPAVLTAAQEVELIRPSESIEPVLKSATNLWRIQGAEPNKIARWWEAHLRSGRPWPAAVAGHSPHRGDPGCG